MYEELQAQRHSMSRLKLSLTRDLEAIDRAIWARTEQGRMDEMRKDVESPN
jgi:hypothetical protein